MKNTLQSETAESRFDFGRNWAHFATTIDESSLARAADGLDRLGLKDLRGKTFLDVGCGSGIHALAAARRGAIVTAIDLDAESVATTNATLAQGGFEGRAKQLSIFSAHPTDIGKFDIVYSWGVLHHTGDVWRALDHAARLVAPGGTLAIALYEKTRFCWAWKIEKRVYSRLPSAVRAPIKWCFGGIFLAARCARRGILPVSALREYREDRGMSFWHDVDDWLGGYPYEATRAAAVTDHVKRLKFGLVHSTVMGHRWGFFGSGCSEFLFDKIE